ncbi:MAG: hypothetical protein RLW61_00395 [Gammaproteobacteria bacterium]
MANLIGTVLVVYGSWLLWSAWRHRRDCLAAPATETEEGPLTILGEVMPPLVMIGLGIAALEVILAYAMIGDSPHFSLFDLLGVLYAIVAYGLWLNVKTRFRPRREGEAGR